MNLTAAVEHLGDEEASERASHLSDRETLDLGSATLHFGRDTSLSGKMIVITSSGKCASIDYPFAPKQAFS